MRYIGRMRVVAMLAAAAAWSCSGDDGSAADADAEVGADDGVEADVDTEAGTAADADAEAETIEDVAEAEDSTPEDAAGPTVTLSGVAFAFFPGGVIEGATVWLAEFPEVTAASGADGFYELAIPVGAPVVVMTTAPGYTVQAHRQFVAVEGEPIEDVKLQMVPTMVFDYFASAVGVAPDPERCQIATTVHVAEILGMDYETFAAYGAHGVGGATAWLEPAVDAESGPVYFTASTSPDRSLTETTVDGGVVWVNVPPGTYTVHASHADHEFQSFTVVCESGGFVNAGPPWGLRQLVP